MTGFDCESFDKILEKFSPMFSGHTPFDASGMIVEFEYVRGQKRVVQLADCLGLVLVWTRTRGALNVLQLCLASPILIIVETFHDDPLARVAIPSREEIETYKVAFSKRHPLLNDCWATMDGLKLYLQASGNSEIQERFYNGWTHDHYVTSVFCFCPNGTIPIAYFNVPGCVHDSQVAEFGKMYEKLEDVYRTTGRKCCIDSALRSVKRNYLYKSCQDHLDSKAPTHWKRKLDLQKKSQATLAWQMAKWGILTMQTSFPRMKDRFVYKERGEQRIVLKMFLILYNMWARMVGINQIQNTYMRHLKRDANADVWF
jgi:hypothetical protein